MKVVTKRSRCWFLLIITLGIILIFICVCYINIGRPVDNDVGFYVISKFASTPSLALQSLVGKDYEKIPEEFKQVMSVEETLHYLDLFETLNRVTRANNITMFLNYGTLLGAVRHHGFTPWDNDGDVAMPVKNKAQILALLGDMSVKPNIKSTPSSRNNVTSKVIEGWDYSWVYSATTQIRFISNKSRVHNRQWGLRWPYVDIDFYSEDANTIWFYHAKRLVYSRAIVFPLVLRPLNGVWLNAPRDSVLYSSQTYGNLSVCLSHSFSHKTGQSLTPISRPCQSLNDVYPYVQRQELASEKKTVRETLMLGNKSLYSVDIGEVAN